MKKEDLIFVSFEKVDNKYAAFMSIDGLFSARQSSEKSLKVASSIYEAHISKMMTLLKEINSLRESRHLLPARKVWELGEIIFALVDELSKLSFQIDGIYQHLERDLGAKRKWLEKVIIFRRYITEESRIPEPLNWGKCEKGTRRIAEQIQKGVVPL